MIVINNEYIYIHNSKTGGTFVTKMLSSVAEKSDNITIYEIPDLKHAGVRKIPDEFKDLQVVTNVRNVFEHYVSRYTFKWWAEASHAQNRFDLERVRNAFPDFPGISFSDFLRLLNEWSFLRKMPENKKEELTGLNLGYNSWTLVRLLIRKPFVLLKKLDQMDDHDLMQEFKTITFLRTENLNTDLFHFLKKLGAEEESLQPILNSKLILPKKGGRGKLKQTWGDYFSQEDIDFVLDKDRLFFRLFADMRPLSSG